MHKQMARFFVIVVLQMMMVVTMPAGLFAAEPVTGTVTTSIHGLVWLDVDGSGSPDQAEVTVGNTPVFIQRLDVATTDATMTMVVYTDEVGGYSLEGLADGTYQIWAETNSDNIFYLVVTIDAVTPTATVDLPVAAHRIFMPTVMR